jgi:DNA-binding response OmpR family regulator
VADGSRATDPGSVLLIEDDPDVLRIVRDRLLAAGYHVVGCDTGERGLTLVEEQHFDAIVLDVGLPGIDGFSVLRSIRADGNRVPVMLLTAAGDETDRVLGLEMGADDYVVKPFSPRELLARVRAVLRRVAPTPTSTAPITSGSALTFGDIVIDTAARVVTVRGEVIALTSRSFDLLAFLSARPGTTFSREELLQHVWKSEPDWQTAATVTEHVHRLRRQIEDNPDSPRHLITVRGNGYRFDA